MGSGRITPMIPDLFSTALPREKSLLTPSVPNSTADMITRHVLPNDLPSAIKQLNDQELEQLLVAVTAEQQRRGKSKDRSAGCCRRISLGTAFGPPPSAAAQAIFIAASKRARGFHPQDLPPPNRPV